MSDFEMTEEEFLECEQAERQKHDDKVKELEKHGSVYNWSDNSICMDCEKVRTLHEDNWQEMCKDCKYWELRR